MSRVLFILILTLITSSCEHYFYKDKEKVENFENFLKIKLSFEEDFKWNSSFVNGDPISRPVGSWQNLLESKSYCLNYRVPSPSNVGVLQVVRKKEANCPVLPTNNEEMSLQNINDLKVKFTTDHIKGKSIRNAVFGFKLSFEYLKEKRELEFPLINRMRSGEFTQAKMTKYSSSGTYRMNKGLRVTRDLDKKMRSSMWPGDWDLKESNQILFCEKKNKDCKIQGESFCGECLYGWEYVVDYNCSGGGSKVCSPVKCGQKGRPACPRGIAWSGIDARELCFDDSPAGFCESDLRVICAEDGILVCN
ncbi:hypothetical protein BIY24_14445 [Halobacteriovorax marinus]|uniref:hypothetical protein n=1 Tax=Halobacteriovorax marinus TaxID=97084 RepID=UPI000BC35EA6|nr:hypothetical protein [Halobacteriovorax marinus]ATH09099.1 hypothetical protein BIY24_14445 [Halobacteriovorax marinus]